MARLNPNKPIREALIACLSPTGIPVKSMKFPIDTRTPKQYILITSQTKQRTEISKDCYDYLCSVAIDVNNINSSGVSNKDIVDDIEEQVVDLIESSMEIDGFVVKEANFVQSIDLGAETATFSFDRRVITYQFWVGQLQTT